MSKHVLVAYGSKRGGTAAIAETIADTLRRDGCTVDCQPAADVRSLAGYDAVVIGGALYVGRWHRTAWRFCMQHAERLREIPVWLFSSGPLDDSAATGELPPTGQVARLMARIGARGHITFGGRLPPDVRGFIARALGKKHGGDWRDWSQIRAWACEVATQIQLDEPVVRPRITRPARRRWPLVALCAIVAVSAIAGGGLLVARPDGSLLRAPVQMLAPSGFTSFLIPGLLLLAFVGGASALAAGLVSRHHRLGPLAAFAAGTTLSVWILCEMVLLRDVHWLQLSFLAMGLAIAGLAFRAGKIEARWAADRVRPISADRSSAYAT